MSEKIIAYKATDKNMMCRGKQYEVGKTYREGKADCCHAGMHACEVPFDVLHYYHVSNGARFFQVECRVWQLLHGCRVWQLLHGRGKRKRQHCRCKRRKQQGTWIGWMLHRADRV